MRIYPLALAALSLGGCASARAIETDGSRESGKVLAIIDAVKADRRSCEAKLQWIRLVRSDYYEDGDEFCGNREVLTLDHLALRGQEVIGSRRLAGRQQEVFAFMFGDEGEVRKVRFLLDRGMGEVSPHG